jgi:hypothetical protein
VDVLVGVQPVVGPASAARLEHSLPLVVPNGRDGDVAGSR